MYYVLSCFIEAGRCVPGRLVGPYTYEEAVERAKSLQALTAKQAENLEISGCYEFGNGGIYVIQEG